MKSKTKLLIGGMAIAIVMLATSLPEQKKEGIKKQNKTEKSGDYTFHLSVFQLF